MESMASRAIQAAQVDEHDNVVGVVSANLFP